MILRCISMLLPIFFYFGGYGFVAASDDISRPQSSTEQHADVDCTLEEDCHPRQDASETTRKTTGNDCSLYLAASLVGPGWGVFAGRDLSTNDTSSSSLLHSTAADPSILVTDIDPEWLDDEESLQYFQSFLQAPQIHMGKFEANDVVVFHTGLGSLTNSHPTLGNLQLTGHADTSRIPRTTPNVGASTHLQNARYELRREVSAGQELVLHPLDGAAAAAAAAAAAYFKDIDVQDIPDDIIPGRSLDDLKEHGMCLDRIVAKDSTISNAGKGAFARHQIQQNQIIAPVPVIAVTRHDLSLTLEQEWPDGEEDHIWDGHQLLVNYAYSHPLSSLLLIPYGAGVSLINHHRGASTSATAPNVVLQWPGRMSSEWFNMSVDQVLAKQSTNSTNMMLQLVATRDIEPGEELFLDYGDNWQRAWERHVELFRPPVHAETYQAPSVWNSQTTLRTMQTDGANNGYYPSYIQVLCKMDRALITQAAISLADQDNDGYLKWKETDDNNYMLCSIESAMASNDDTEEDEISYRVTVTRRSKERNEHKVKGVPRSAVVFVEKLYTGDQFLRHAFRHPIELPASMWPSAWNDIVFDKNECGLYMAESTIPNAGMGIYTAKDIDEEDPVDSMDLAIIHPRLFQETNQLIDCYSEEGVDGLFERDWKTHALYSAVPGIGMLANALPGKHNIEYGPYSFLSAFGPKHVNTYSRRGTSKGAGASTNRHGVSFHASRNTQAGEELFIPYSWDKFSRRCSGLVEKPKREIKKRTVGWLKENGSCVDNLRAGDSTLLNAGKGAFARRAMAEGELIAPMPLIQMSRLDMQTEQFGRQLLLNYCYGHSDSSLLLFPYSPIVNYVNHNKTRMNARIQWSKLPRHTLTHKRDWLDRLPDEIVAETEVGLMMELVATQGIEAGEEIFIDYGDAWEQAWVEYRNIWKPPAASGSYLSAAELNNRVEWLYTVDEHWLATTPNTTDETYTACVVSTVATPGIDASQSPHGMNEFLWYPADVEQGASPPTPCEILSRSLVSSSNVADIQHAWDRKDSIHPILVEL